jgi:hypothetical protein
VNFRDYNATGSVLLLLARYFDEVTALAVSQQPCGNLLGRDEPLMLPVGLLDDPRDDREDISVFPGRFHGRVPPP